jgi:hypothetical protein
VKEGKKILYANDKQRRTGVAMFMSDKIDFKLKNITTNKGICLVVKE